MGGFQVVDRSFNPACLPRRLCTASQLAFFRDPDAKIYGSMTNLVLFKELSGAICPHA
jgi:hypothetical protein